MQRSVFAEVAAPILDRMCQDVLWPSDLAAYDDGFMWVQETSRRRSPTKGYRREKDDEDDGRS